VRTKAAVIMPTKSTEGQMKKVVSNEFDTNKVNKVDESNVYLLIARHQYSLLNACASIIKGKEETSTQMRRIH
jgi:hypothetical protein